MNEKIRVLVVDDSAFMRKVISDMINSQPDMEVIDTARDGDMAVLKILSLNPDVITLDVEMPKKNGLQVLKEIKEKSHAAVIMLSSLTAEGSYITIEALGAGAFDFIQKPSGSISLDIEKVKEDLVEKIRFSRAHAIKKAVPRIRESIPPKAHDLHKLSKNIEAAVFGASTGGPRVLYDVITKLPEDLNIPVFVVQHMPAGFTKAFAERINNNSRLNVVEASDGEHIRANNVYIAPGGFHMVLERGFIRLELTPAMHGVRPAVDKLFASASQIYGERLIACVFTGMGKDGAEGVRIIKSRGGYIIAQDEETSIVYGMPKAAFETGCVDIVLPDNKIPQQIISALKSSQ